MQSTSPAHPSASIPTDLPCAGGDVDTFLSAPSDSTVECLGRYGGPILVLGAGGKMGLHLSAMLARARRTLNRRDPVIGVSRFRGLRDREEFARFGVETLPCDLEDPAQLRALPEAPVIFFLAGVKFGTAGAPDLLQRVNAEMPRRVAERFSSSRFVAFSTGCVYPFVSPASGGANEDVPPEPPGAYAASCLAREQAFSECSQRFGTKAVLIRLNYSVEFRYGVLVDIALKVQRGEPVDVTMGYVNAIWQSDALNYAIRALDLAAAPAVPLNVTGPEIISIREAAEKFGELLGRRPVIVGREADTAWLNDASRLHRQFGRPRVPLDDILHWVAAWVGRNGEVWNKPTGFERRDGKF